LGIKGGDIQGTEDPFELDLALFFRDTPCVMNASGAEIKFKNAVTIHIIGQGATILRKDFTSQTDVFPGALHFSQ
jgi:hypothetical protein